ncbi:d72378f3-8ffd-4bcc-8ce4-89a6da7ae54d [Thermothielavioides terrestris]|uniref:D72378f3-8ffd-4bcc-8ce4-89a6da7ae54d n=1 Tax=Thermothielavioides terrestris TaxID=2587410 RepID=A0A446BAM9_9PEZI|nr:d72378f3-8ffd-4bcc-8ce4-89a6da7ae54d [Thermothielavioides terrestris]
MANGGGDTQEEDEAVRCVCGNEEYQGPPPFDEDSKHGLKHASDLEPFFSADVTDDTAGLFVQCDICKVWQHGGCVGIMTEESSPDEYFCEQCRQDLHKLWTASNGSVYSHYLPLKRQARTTSRAASLNKDTARSPTKEKDNRNGRTTSTTQTSKRRSTLNSREAGYDEAEALRRAIEASKEEALAEQAENGNRRPKRGRSDSQEKPENSKRQKTSSRSASPVSDKNADDSDDAGASGRNAASKSKSRNGAAARNQRPEKASEKEERERQRAETANKRKGRADRRRADDSDPSEELPLAARAVQSKTAQAQATGNSNAASVTTEAVQPPAAAEPPPSSNPAPDTPPQVTVQSKSDKKRSHKKKGRNQYTRDRDGHDEDSPARSQSRDIQKDDHGPPSGGKAAGEGGGGKASSKSKGGMSSKITMNDMKRRAAALLDFISRTQVELAGESFTGPTAGTGSSTLGSVAAASKDAQSGAGGDAPVSAPDENGEGRQEKEFTELGCMEMMDSLTRRLVKWQQQYAS